MKNIKEYILESSVDEGFFKNTSSDLKSIITQWIVNKFKDDPQGKRIIPRFPKAISADNIIDNFKLGTYYCKVFYVGSGDLIDGEFPEFIKFKSPFNYVGVKDCNIKSLDNIPVSSHSLELNSVKDLVNFKGLDTHDIQILLINNCPDLKSLDGLNINNSELNCINISNCPRLSDISALYGCNSSSFELTGCPAAADPDVVKKMIASKRCLKLTIELDLLKNAKKKGIDVFKNAISIDRLNIYHADLKSDRSLIEDMVPWDKLKLRADNMTDVNLYGSYDEGPIHHPTIINGVSVFQNKL